MPVSAKISDIVKNEAASIETEHDTRTAQPTASRSIKTKSKTKKAADNAVTDSKPSVQHLTFEGIEVKPDTTIAGAIAGRKKRRRDQSREAKERKKQKRTIDEQSKASIAKFQRAQPLPPTVTAKLKGKEKRLVQRTQDTTTKLVTEAARHQLLETPSTANSGISVSENDVTWRISQAELKQSVDTRTAQKSFDLVLPHGPYRVDYTRDGRHSLIGGAKGHVSLMQWENHKLLTEFDCKEEIRDVQFLHSYQMFAVAQSSYVYLYDSSGLELHVLKHHRQPQRLIFLPYHYMLASIGDAGWLKYQDTSTGQIVAEHRTKLGKCKAMTQNPQNAVLHCGHHNGTVTLWSPNMTEPLVTMLTHKTDVLDLAVSAEGHTMTTSGLDGQVHCWDLRTYKVLHSYFTVRPATSVAISQHGVLALGYGAHVTLWKDALRTKQQSPYLSHLYPASTVSDLSFVPYEDLLGVGHTGGVSQMIVPSSGFSHYDSLETDIFATKQSRREAVVHSLLDKLQPSMISLNNSLIGMMDARSKQVYEGDRAAMRVARFQQEQEKTVGTNKMRGGQKSSARHRRKRANIIDKATVERREAIEKREREQKAAADVELRAAKGEQPVGALTVLARFAKKKE